MGGLAHFFEEDGLPTTQISLIREHTETIKPPRALWVPFELGRPLGVPGDSVFQSRVLLSALKLLEAPAGPVIEDFPEEAPASDDEDVVLACSVDLTQESKDLSSTEQLREALRIEMAQLRSWYDLAVKEHGRTTVGASGLALDTLGDFVSSFLEEDLPSNPSEELPLGMVLKLAVDDLKAFYTEAAASQPGALPPGSGVLADWFWSETVAGKVLLAIKELCAKSEDKVLKLVGNMLIVPMARAQGG